MIGLTVSQRAARVLSEEGVDTAANIAKFLDTNRRMAAGLPVAEQDRNTHQLQPSQLVMVDEASMAETGQLDEIRRLAAGAGAKVVYVGDSAQLGAVGSGGMFGQLSEELPNVHRLEEVLRFSNDWEKAASLELRKGNRQALAAYEDRGRLLNGSREEMKKAAYHRGWPTTSAGATACSSLRPTSRPTNSPPKPAPTSSGSDSSRTRASSWNAVVSQSARAT